MLNTIICNAIVLAPAAYFAIAFALHLTKCWQRTATPAEVVAAEEIAPAVPTEPATSIKTLPDDEPPTAPAWWRSLTAQQLRSVYKRNGIEWRNAATDGRHLSKRQMLSALDLLPQVA